MSGGYTGRLGERIYRVVADYRVAYPDPLVVRAGEELRVGEEDTDYRGWAWCTNLSGKGGWFPLNNIEWAGRVGRARDAYEATELSANAGDELVMSREESGWAWCTNRDGRSGWIPVAHLERLG